jgi:hypothetical protein
VARWLGKRRSGPRPRPDWHKPFLLGGRIPGYWFQRAWESGLERGAIYVGVVLWYLRSLHNSMTFEFSSIEAERWGIAPDTKSRALRALQKAELIRLEWKRGRNPKVTLLPQRNE